MQEALEGYRRAAATHGWKVSGASRPENLGLRNACRFLEGWIALHARSESMLVPPWRSVMLNANQCEVNNIVVYDVDLVVSSVMVCSVTSCPLCTCR